MAEASLAGTAINVLAAPNEAFKAIRARPLPIFPLAIFLIGVISVQIVYLYSVDIAWMIENQLRASPRTAELTDQQIQNLVEQSSLPPGVLAAISAVSASVIVTLILAVFALYLWIASSVAKHGLNYGRAFALVCWTALPGVLGFVASIVNMLANDATFMPQHQINPLSFSSLFAMEPAAGSIGQQILLQLDLTAIWSAVLVVLGYQAWSGKSLTVAAGIVLAPYVLLAGLALAT